MWLVVAASEEGKMVVICQYPERRTKNSDFNLISHYHHAEVLTVLGILN